jgi:23S rRNA (adenine1618-N6)-methyltransferase
MPPHKPELHSRNRNNNLYDFKQLVAAIPDLAKYVTTTPVGAESIDFSNPIAVKALNQAILKVYYNIDWNLPGDYLCPPIPGRADYLHYIADLLSEAQSGLIPQGEKITVLDIGVGANCIYPLLGSREYGWSFVGTEINPEAVCVAKDLIEQNELTNSIEILHQKSPASIFKGLPKDLHFDISMCNPPFHASLTEAREGTRRKWKNLRIKSNQLNFGGQENELWYPGGEVAFITRMIEESPNVKCTWFTTLVSKETSLPGIYNALNKLKGIKARTIPMGQGQKKSRIVAWTFQHPSSL